MQKRNGIYLLAVWLDAISWQIAAPSGEVSPVPTAAVTLGLSPAVPAIKYWTPHTSATATTLTPGFSWALTVPDHPMIIEFTGG